MNHFDVIILGAGGAGMFCASKAASRGRSVLILDHSKKLGAKILISGGGRCNFTNLGATANNYVSNNPHFCKSAFARYTPWDFIELINKYGIKYQKNDRLFLEKISMVSNQSQEEITKLFQALDHKALNIYHSAEQVINIYKRIENFKKSLK